MSLNSFSSDTMRGTLFCPPKARLDFIHAANAPLDTNVTYGDAIAKSSLRSS